MSKSVKAVKIFVASPDDTTAERELVKKVANELNHGFAQEKCVRLDVVDWLSDSWPGIGEDAQDVINRQIGEYDIFIGILWKRFGKPTKRASSGTVEEFQIAYKLWRKKPATAIMMYFNQQPFFPNREDIDSCSKILDFKLELQEKGLRYHHYVGEAEFESRVRQHLTQQLIGGRKGSTRVTRVKALLADHAGLTNLSLYANKVLLRNQNAALIYIDVDKFTRFNDLAGTEAADDWLFTFTEMLLKIIGKDGEVLRISGDEFAIILPGAGVSQASDVADRVQRQLPIPEGQVPLTISFGIIVMDSDNPRAGEAVKEVRDAVHLSKIRGGNRITFCPLSEKDAYTLKGHRSWEVS